MTVYNMWLPVTDQDYSVVREGRGVPLQKFRFTDHIILLIYLPTISNQFTVSYYPTWCYLLSNISFGNGEVLIWFRDSLLGVVIRWCDRPRTNISQENVLTTIVAKCQFRA